ncbi:hypothetical protein SD70_28220 [Gordoniibacillus kamchatkensis]|uniref:Uncharacterized protein n=1 Tax=Gordoniibacillus kamchatkensis TaxID=1590651 RepID=A0ABR5AB01_9BACL|nr:hypothetical protein SD70_28220 [Paenibacillus sp. VKM B-2647]
MSRVIAKSVIVVIAIFFVVQMFISASGMNLAAHPVFGITLAILAVLALLALPISKLIKSRR